jgi:uncharacterized radical SAM protein YgiQ
VRETEGINHAYVTSGIRYDLFLHEKGVSPETKASHQTYVEELAAHHVPGRIKVAPEHTSDHVLRVMRKPSFDLFHKFKQKFEQASVKAGKKKLPVVPYFISSHPGSRPEDMAELALKTKDLGFRLEQVQDFTPTPGSLSTCIYHTGMDPFTGKTIHIPRTAKERRLQKALLLYHRPESKADVLEALKISKREDAVKVLFDRADPRKTTKRSQKNRRQNRPAK